MKIVLVWLNVSSQDLWFEELHWEWLPFLTSNNHSWRYKVWVKWYLCFHWNLWGWVFNILFCFKDYSCPPWGAKTQTQGLVHTRQVLYHWAAWQSVLISSTPFVHHSDLSFILRVGERSIQTHFLAQSFSCAPVSISASCKSLRGYWLPSSFSC